MQFKTIMSFSSIFLGLVLLSACGGETAAELSSSTDTTTDTTTGGTVTIDLIEDYVFERTVTLTLSGTALTNTDFSDKKFFLDYPNDDGFYTSIITFNDDNASGVVRNAPSADNAYTAETLTLTWSIRADGNLTGVMTGTETFDVLINPLNDTAWPNQNVLVEVTDQVPLVKIHYPAKLVETTTFNPAGTWGSSDSTNCHGPTATNNFTVKTADYLEENSIKIKNDSKTTGNSTMDNVFDNLTVGQIRLLSEYIASL